MSRHTLFNCLLAVVVLGLVGTVIYIEQSRDASGAAGSAIGATTTLHSILGPTSLPSTTLAPTTLSPTTVPPTTVPPSTEPPTTLPPTTLPPPERASVPVVVTSAGLTGERVGPSAFLLAAVGWSDIRGLNAAVPATPTTVYFADGFQSAAELMAVDLTLPVTSVAPLATAPPIAGLGNAALVVYLGG